MSTTTLTAEYLAALETPRRIPVAGKPHLHKVGGMWAVDYETSNYYPNGEMLSRVAARLNDTILAARL